MVMKLPLKYENENGVDKRGGLLYALKQRLENYNNKNQKCPDEHYEAFVKGQLNNLKEASLHRYHYLRTELSKDGVKKRTSEEASSILDIGKKISSIGEVSTGRKASNFSSKKFVNMSDIESHLGSQMPMKQQEFLRKRGELDVQLKNKMYQVGHLGHLTRKDLQVQDSRRKSSKDSEFGLHKQRKHFMSHHKDNDPLLNQAVNLDEIKELMNKQYKF